MGESLIYYQAVPRSIKISNVRWSKIVVCHEVVVLCRALLIMSSVSESDIIWTTFTNRPLLAWIRFVFPLVFFPIRGNKPSWQGSEKENEWPPGVSARWHLGREQKTHDPKKDVFLRYCDIGMSFWAEPFRNEIVPKCSSERKSSVIIGPLFCGTLPLWRDAGKCISKIFVLFEPGMRRTWKNILSYMSSKSVLVRPAVRSSNVRGSGRRFMA